MKKFLSFVFVTALTVFSITGILFYHNTHAREDGRFRLYILGDNLSNGYGLAPEDAFYSRLNEALAKEGYNNVQIINGSVTEETAENAVKRLDKIMVLKPHAVILELGYNDFSNGSKAQDIETHLNTIITFFEEKDIPVLLVGVLPPQGSVLEERENFTNMYPRLAEKHKLVLCPNFLKDVLVGRFGTFDYKNFQHDGTNPNAEGVKIMVKNFVPYVKRFFKSME